MTNHPTPDLAGETWAARQLGRFYQEHIVTSDAGDVCHVLGSPQERRQAYTALIIAAPRLLSACRTAARHLRENGDDHADVLRLLEQAIELAQDVAPAEEQAPAEASR